ncbi:MAG: hypothetical protein V4620_00555 [Bacteroidota bacterium]
MLKSYKFMYYRMFDLLQQFGNYDLAWGASHGLALFIGLCILNSLYLIGEYMNVKTMGALGVSTFLIIHIINYFLFLKDNKYKEVIEYYNKEPKNQKKIGRFIVIIMTVILIYSLF